MQYKALVSFSGVISMAMGEVREISDLAIVDDLVGAGYIMPMQADEKAEEKPKKRRKKANEN